MDDNNNIVPQSSSDEVPDGLKEFIEEVGGKEIALRCIAIAEKFSGPLPHPRILGQYRDIMPDAPKRIFGMAERQQGHRIDIEKSVIVSDIRRADTGLILGFLLFALFGIGSIILLAIGKDIQGFAMLATSLLGGIGNFIRVGRERTRATKEYDKIPKRKKRKKKPSD